MQISPALLYAANWAYKSDTLQVGLIPRLRNANIEVVQACRRDIYSRSGGAWERG